MNQDYEQNLAKRATSDGEAHPEKEPISKQGKNPKKRSWRRTLISSMIFLLLGSVAGGSIYGWFFVQRKLIPLIETEAGNYLHRPLELGNLRSISLASASFGKSALPATEDNPDFVEVKQVKINFALLHFLRRRELKLDLILVKSNLYLEQDASKLWTPTDFGSDDSETGGIEVDVRSIQLDGGQMSLAAYNSATDSLNPPVTARIDRVVLRPRKDRIEFNVAANLLRGGRFTVIGRGNTETGVINLDFVARKLAAAEVSSLLALPIELNQGNLDGKLGVTLTDAPIPELHGELALDDVSMQVPGLVKPFSSSDGKVGFSGSMVELRKVTSNFGQVEAVASGSLDLADVGDYQIDAQVQPVTMPQVFEALELEAPVPVAGEIRGAVAVRGSLDNPLVKFDLATVGASRLDQLDFQQINADLELLGSTLAIKQLDSLPLGGGKIEGSGLLKLDSTESLTFNLRANRVSAKAIADSYEQDLPVDIGRISGQTNLTLQAGELSTLKLRRGTANFDLGNGIVKLDNLNYGNGRWSSRLTSQGVEFGSLPFGEGSTPTIAKGLVDGVFQVTGTKDFDDLSQLDAEGTGALKTVGGQVALNKIKIADGSWNTDAQTENLQLQQLFPELPDEFDDNLSGEFYLTGNIPDQAQPQTLINGFGDLILASGEVKVSDLAIVDQDWKAIAKGTNLRLKQLSSTTPDQFAGLIDGTLELSGTTDDITPEGIIALGDGSLTLPEGVFAAQELAIADGKFRAQVTPQEVDLELFADPNSDELELKGQLGGNLALTGNVDDLSPTAVAAKGRLTFSQGLDLLEQSFAAGVVWDGRRLDVKQAQGDGLNAQGHVVLDPSFFEDIPDKLAAVDYFEFDVTEARWLDVKKLRLNLPTWAVNLDYSGRGDFAGQISGNPSAMNIGGNVGLKDFKVEEVGFAPFLAGNVQISPKTGVKLSLQEILTNPLLSTAEESGSEAQPLDKIELVLDRNFAPLSMAIAQDTLLIEGTGNQEILDLKGQNIPVKLLKTIAVKSEDIAVPENLAPQALDGLLSGDFTFNLNTLATSGSNVIIEDPTLASVRGDRLEGDFQYADGYFGIQDVEFRQRNSIYKLDGNISQNRDDLELDGKISIDGGQIQDILVALQIFELSDFARIFSDRN
ncbi:MAG: translocation/assembly module TamB, partial [Cyanobacteria bacterium J06558_2]